MRYFCCTSSGRPYIIDGQTFIFEPTDLRGGSWFGVLAVDDSAANILQNCGIPMIGEIPQAEYDREKKKVTEPVRSSAPSLGQPMGNPLIQPLARPAGVLTVPTSVEAEPEIQGTIETTDQAPPADPLLDQRVEKFTGLPKKE